MQLREMPLFITSLITSQSGSRFTHRFLKLFSLALVSFAIAPFLENWYAGKVEKRLYEDKYNAQLRADEIDTEIQRLNLDRNYIDLTKEAAERQELLQLKLIQLENAAKAANEIAKRKWQRFVSSEPWWKYVPVAAAPVSLYEAFDNFFSPTFSPKVAVWSMAVNACLFFGMLGCWKSRRWGGYAMGGFCLLFAGKMLFEMCGVFAPSLLTSIVNIVILAICLVPVALLAWANGTKSSLVDG